MTSEEMSFENIDDGQQMPTKFYKLTNKPSAKVS